MKAWRLLAAMALAVSVPAIGSAQLLEPPTAEATATPAAEAPAKLRPEEDRIARMIRSAERESFEHHEIDRALAIYTPDAALVFGRRAAPDEHDVRYDPKTLRAVLEVRYVRPPAKQEQVFFRDVEVKIDGDSATMEAVVARELFSGREELHHRYTLARRDGRWRVTAQRVWPLMRTQGGVPTVYTDESWLAAEEKATEALEADGTGWQARMFALTAAGWMPRAHAETVKWTAAEPKSVQAWLARHRFALEVGDVKDARAAWEKAKALGAPPKAQGGGR